MCLGLLDAEDTETFDCVDVFALISGENVLSVPLDGRLGLNLESAMQDDHQSDIFIEMEVGLEYLL